MSGQQPDQNVKGEMATKPPENRRGNESSPRERSSSRDFITPRQNRHSRYQRQRGGRSNTPRRRTRATRTNLAQASRYTSLDYMCRKCDKICQENFDDFYSIKCCTCKAWFHADCLDVEKKVLEELSMKNSFICDNCKSCLDDSHDSGTSEGGEYEESSMNSEDNFRAQFDECMDTTNQKDGDATDYAKADNQQVSANHVDNVNVIGAEKMANMSTKSHEDDKSQGTSPVAASTPIDKHTPHTARQASTDSTLETKAGAKMNENDQTKVKQTISSNMSNLGKLYPTDVEKKIENVQKIVSEMNNNLRQTDTKIKLMDAQQDVYLRATTFKITESMNKLVDDAVTKLNKNLTSTIDKEVGKIGQKIDNVVSNKIDQTLGKTIEEKIDKKFDQNMTQKIQNMIDKQIDERISLRLDHKINKIVEEKVGDNLNEMVDTRVGQSIDGKFNHFQEQLWRRNNVLVVNLPESTKRSVDEKKRDDLAEVEKIFNKLVHLEQWDIVGLPVRVGLIRADKPRMLRVNMRSEVMVKELVYKARVYNYLINPGVEDKGQKIYVNRDYTIIDRMERKEALKEKKEKEAVAKEGEKYVIRRNKCIRLDQKSYAQAAGGRNYRPQDQAQGHISEAEYSEKEFRQGSDRGRSKEKSDHNIDNGRHDTNGQYGYERQNYDKRDGRENSRNSQNNYDQRRDYRENSRDRHYRHRNDSRDRNHYMQRDSSNRDHSTSRYSEEYYQRHPDAHRSPFHRDMNKSANSQMGDHRTQEQIDNDRYRLPPPLVEPYYGPHGDRRHMITRQSRGRGGRGNYSSRGDRHH